MKLRLLPCLLAALSLFAAAPLAAQAPSVDPFLWRLARPDARQMAAEEARVTQPGEPLRRTPLAGVVQLRLDLRGRPAVPLLLELRDAGALAELRALGAEIGGAVGQIVTATVPLENLERLFTMEGLRRVEAAPSAHPVNDIGAQLTRANDVRVRQGNLWTGYAGQGVIVGIYDTGIDLAHEDFHNPDGTTRLLGLWDQPRGGTPPSGFAYGNYCSPAAINGGTCAQRDLNGHGTHVAGTAAGTGAATGPGGEPYRYTGVAPMADLLVVNGDQAGFPVNRIIDGVNWIFQEAARLGRPAVVNLSLGVSTGPRDGTSLFEAAMDQLSGPGRVVIAASGNSGSNFSPDRLIHAMLPSGGGTFAFEIPAYTPSAVSCQNEIAFELWYGGSDRIRATVTRPDGSSLSGETGDTLFQPLPSGNIDIILAPDPLPQNDDRRGIIWVDGCRGAGPPQAGEWTLHLEFLTAPPSKPLHAWMVVNRLGGQPRARGTTGFDNAFLVAAPASAQRVIAVGAYTSKQSWTSAGGSSFTFNPGPTGNITRFSSGGPTRDGRLKPEITAPGSAVVSSRSADATVGDAQLVAGRRHMALQGTSMSAPFVTGAVAILLQRAGGLTPEEARQLLSETAIRDSFTPVSYTRVPGQGENVGHPNEQWGFGKLDVAAALAAASVFATVPTLLVDVLPLEPEQAPVVSARGTRLTLLRLVLRADGPEPVDVRQLGFRVTGNDPDARLILVRRFGDRIAPEDPLLRSIPAPLHGDTVAVTVSFGAGELRVAPGDSVGLLVGLELGGGAPQGTLFRGWFAPDLTRAEGAATGSPAQVRQPGIAIAGHAIPTILLLPGELLVLSENPIRSGRLVLNFRNRPRSVAAVYTLSGRRVVDFLPRLADGDRRLEWDLRNEQGGAVAPGVYVLVFDVGERIERQRLIVHRPAGTQE
jgi:subtilisin family serine protease